MKKDENKVAFFPAEEGWTLKDVINEENLMRRTIVDNTGITITFNTIYGHGDGINSRHIGRGMTLTIEYGNKTIHTTFLSKKKLEKFRDIIDEYIERYKDRFLNID